MEYSLDSYRMIARAAAIAHREKDAPTATNSFALLWQRLDRENLTDHCDARAAFNIAFARAYRGQASDYIDPAPAPALVCNEGRCTRGCAGKCKGLGSRDAPAPAPRYSRRDDKVARQVRSAALDCAAFFAKTGA